MGRRPCIDPERLTVEAYRRTGEGVWTLRDVPNGELLYLDGLKLEIAWQRVFRNVVE
ncbi:hypothetical protein [Desulfonatronum thioautotrophicum]|uniref:hypothetical protein n=1 Tax=Desulfonatronum thioautotrophicum TaxID=617001 RepID=UPI0012947058|nr:hypothetical protein [Desulfonatronum thioautotrophicum]